MFKKIISLFLGMGVLSLLSVGCFSDLNDLSKKDLTTSLELGRQFLLNNQKEEGNFEYEYNFIEQMYTEDDNEVRQAGALWGLTLIHQYNPDDATELAIQKAFAFFESESLIRDDGKRAIVYKESEYGKTGTVALMVLALTEFLNTEKTIENRENLENALDGYLQFLMSLRREDGLFYGSYKTEDGSPFGGPSPYFDGEALLAMIKAAKTMGYEELKPWILESAEQMHETYVDQAWEEDSDSDLTKGFYQWGSMAFYEIYTSGWEDIDFYDDWTIEMADWMIDVHRTLARSRNTGYAYEGIIHAWELARLTENKVKMEKFKNVIQEGLTQLMSWQVGGPMSNSFLEEYSTEDPRAVGGAMNEEDEPLLRIDVTQHQMHAVILALKFLF